MHKTKKMTFFTLEPLLPPPQIFRFLKIQKDSGDVHPHLRIVLIRLQNFPVVFPTVRECQLLDAFHQ